MPERLSTLDASFLYLEKPHLHMHVGGLAVFDPTDSPSGPLTFERLRELTASRIHLVPRWRQRVLFPPLNVGRPVWADDPHFNPGYHLRRTALPAPGGDDELKTLVGRVMSQNLDRARPLWEMWVVEGLSEGRWALLSKVHHCMVDGVATTDLMTVLMDAERDAKPTTPPAWVPEPVPGRTERAASFR